MPRAKSPVRLALALSIAALLAVFLLYTSIAGGGTPSLKPSQVLRKHPKHNVTVSGVVLGPISGNAQAQGLRFRLRDIKGTATVRVVYHGAVPDLFRAKRDISVDGKWRNGVFQGQEPLVTKCPSKYSPKS